MLFCPGGGRERWPLGPIPQAKCSTHRAAVLSNHRCSVSVFPLLNRSWINRSCGHYIANAPFTSGLEFHMNAKTITKTSIKLRDPPSAGSLGGRSPSQQEESAIGQALPGVRLGGVLTNDSYQGPPLLFPALHPSRVPGSLCAQHCDNSYCLSGRDSTCTLC